MAVFAHCYLGGVAPVWIRGIPFAAVPDIITVHYRNLRRIPAGLRACPGLRLERGVERGILVAAGAAAPGWIWIVFIQGYVRGVLGKYLYRMYVVAVAQGAVHAAVVQFIACVACGALRALGI